MNELMQEISAFRRDIEQILREDPYVTVEDIEKWLFEELETVRHHPKAELVERICRQLILDTCEWIKKRRQN